MTAMLSTMNKAVAFMLVASFAASAQAAEPAFKRAYRLDPSKVVVVDGDTIHYRNKPFRLYGYDAPELFHARCPAEKVLAQAAKETLEEEVQRGGILRLRASRKPDKYGRAIGLLTVSKRDIAKTLIDIRLAVPYFGRGPRKDWCS